MGIFSEKDKDSLEENAKRMEEIVLSTGNVNRKYIVRDLIFCSDQLKIDLFAPSVDLNQLLLPIKQQLKAKALRYGADAVINCHFDYQQKKLDEQLITEILAYGTVVQFTPTTIG